MKIGLVPMSAKPYHVGHHKMVVGACNENDKTKVFVSLSDRHRKNEWRVSGSTMEMIWEKYLINIIPADIELQFVTNPVRKIYELLGRANEMHSRDTYTIYSGEDDLAKNFPVKSLKKYVNELLQHRRINLKPTERIVSGTKMRSFVMDNAKDLFVNYMPHELSLDERTAIFELLRNEPQ